MKRTTRPSYLMEDFDERREYFMSQFHRLSTPKEREMIRDRNSFEHVFTKALSRDESLK